MNRPSRAREAVHRQALKVAMVTNPIYMNSWRVNLSAAKSPAEQVTWVRRRPIRVANTTRLACLQTRVAEALPGHQVEVVIGGLGVVATSDPVELARVAASSRASRSELLLKVTPKAPDAAHSYSYVLALSPGQSSIKTTATQYADFDFATLVGLVEAECEQYPRHGRHKHDPVVGDIDFEEDSVRRHIEEVETIAARRGAIWGGLTGAASGLIVTVILAVAQSISRAF